MNDQRLKQGTRVFDRGYFKELPERVRSIRAGERRIYLQITDINDWRTEHERRKTALEISL